MASNRTRTGGGRGDGHLFLAPSKTTYLAKVHSEAIRGMYGLVMLVYC